MASWAPSLQAQWLQGGDTQSVRPGPDCSSVTGSFAPSDFCLGPAMARQHAAVWKEWRRELGAFLKGAERGSGLGRVFTFNPKALDGAQSVRSCQRGPWTGCCVLNPIPSFLFTFCAFSFKTIFLTFASWQSRASE